MVYCLSGVASNVGNMVSTDTYIYYISYIFRLSRLSTLIRRE